MTGTAPALGFGEGADGRRTLGPAMLTRFRDGDQEALAELYDHFSRPVWSIALSILRDRQLAEDCTQEVFLRAWRNAASLDPTRDPGPWLFTIARRAAIDLLRTESRPTQGGHTGEHDVLVAAPALEHVWETWQVRTALDDLPAEERDVVRMAHFQQMTHREIATALEVPVGTVKSRSHRAHRRLADRLAHLLSGGDA